MREEMHNVTVMLAPVDGGAPIAETILSECPKRAASIAARIHPQLTVVAILARTEVIGRCDRCGAFVFATERHGQRGGHLVCEDC